MKLLCVWEQVMVSVWLCMSFKMCFEYILVQGVTISWQERQMNSHVLCILCFSSWHTSCNVTMEPPRMDQRSLFCLETKALENGPDSYIVDPDWSRLGPVFSTCRCNMFLFIWRDIPLWHVLSQHVCVSVYRDLNSHTQVFFDGGFKT